MDFYNRHLTSYGYDRKLVFIKDKLIDYLKHEIEQIGFDHVSDEISSLINNVKETSLPGYAIIEEEFVLIDCYSSIQKARERIFQILCAFRKSFEHLARFSLELCSFNDEQFYLVSFLDKKYKLVSAIIDKEKKILVIKTNRELINYICDTYLISKFRKERFGLIVFDENQSNVLKIKKQLGEKFNYYESSKLTIEEQKEEIKNELIPYFIVITSSLAKKGQVKIVSFAEEFERNVDVDSLASLLDIYDKKLINVIYNLTLKKHLSYNIKEVDLCEKCAKKNKNMLKTFSQKLNYKVCNICQNDLDVLTYLDLQD